jgi:hypothetical protein
MPHYHIGNKQGALNLGVYAGDDERGAYRALLEDAGEDADDPMDPDLVFTEVEPCASAAQREDLAGPLAELLGPDATRKDGEHLILQLDMRGLLQYEGDRYVAYCPAGGELTAFFN